MPFPSPAEKTTYVRQMFARIARRYDLMNRLMSGGRDVAWRRRAVETAALPPGGLALDVGTGTGDLLLMLLEAAPAVRALGVDITPEMMALGKSRLSAADERAAFIQGDALRLPFPTATFDALVNGFLLRNLPDLPTALAEMHRVVRPGGRVVCLDITRPPRGPFGWLFHLYFFHWVPFLGGLISGDWEAYRYLPRSAQRFVDAEELAAMMRAAGLREVRYQKLMMGTVALHVGVRGV